VWLLLIKWLLLKKNLANPAVMKGDGVGAFTRVVSYINLAAASLESSEHSLAPRDVFGSLPSSPQDVWH
jgi:hypothetical protein